MTQHTDGPWEITYLSNGRLYEVETVSKESGTYRHITNALPFMAIPGEPRDCHGNSLEQISNAELIATAPDLYDKLCDLLEWAKGNRGIKNCNPYGVPEVQEALQVLADLQHCKNSYDAVTKI